MLNFLKQNKDKYLMLFLIIVQQIIVIFYLENSLTKSYLLTDKLVYIFILINLFYLYLAGVMRSNNDIILKKIIYIISCILWQHLFILNSNIILYKIGIVMQPVVLYLFIVESFNILLYGKNKFKSKIDKFIVSLILVSIILFFINKTWFNFVYLIIFIGLHIYPLIIMLIYQSYFQGVLSKVKKGCQIFSLFAIGLLVFNCITGMFIHNSYANVGWYIISFTICLITYLKVIQGALILKLNKLLGKITLLSYCISFIFISIWLFLIYIYVDFISVMFILSISELLIFILILQIYIYLKYKQYVEKDSFNEIAMLTSIQNEEKIKENVAIYLHDEILQSIIAIKNFVQGSSCENEYKTIILDELKNLVDSIRSEMDTYRPVIGQHCKLKNVYRELINDVVKKHKSNKYIDLICDENLTIYKPYDVVVYRIIKEIVNNAVKYSTDYNINLILEVRFDKIYISSENVTDNFLMNEHGMGIESIKNSVLFLNGHIDYGFENNIYFIQIFLPMNRRVCYENFID